MNADWIQRGEWHFSAPGGRGSLFARSWSPETPDWDVVLVHGLGEHSGRYEALGTWFAARGVAVHAYDHQGHGRSQGPAGHVRRFQDWVDDLAFFVQTVSAGDADRPLFLLGHSLGGLVVAEFLRTRPQGIRGGVLSGAALVAPDQHSKLKRLAVQGLRVLAPRLQIDNGVEPEQLCREASVVEAYCSDPWVHRRVTLNLAAEVFAAMEGASAGAGEIEVPLLLLHGSEDRIVPSRASEGYAAAVHGDAQLRLCPGLRHEVFNEPEREAIFSEALVWMADRSKDG